MKRFVLIAALVAVPAHAGWTNTDTVDKMTDEKRPSSMVFDANGNSTGIACLERGQLGVGAFVLSDRFLGKGERAVTYRFDSEPPHTATWDYSGSGAYAPGKMQSADRDAFILGLRNAKRLVARVSKYNGDTVDFEFNVSGAATEIDRVFAACGDTLPAQ